ncbi:acid protease [Sporormia fimetaria CBS 119925]|uniref:Acid protease n=1 Tax=Sporormia fimetaria CBS 119925 TaxID=1340428 RepID=A0A6A6V6K2_9PLEO|nr:acid protease [Sporormia fimetaria CBS 119925]
MMSLVPREDGSNTTILPTPYVFRPSGQWDGNDGKWSTFVINIGDIKAEGRGQNFRTLISTSSSLTQVPLQADWCGDAECAKSRGVEVFDSRQSLGLKTEPVNGFTRNGLFNLPTPFWWPGNEQINASYGRANVGLGPSSSDSEVLPDQEVAGVANDQFFMGSFGLAIAPVDFGGGPRSTFLETYRQNDRIPSMSYGYTAGARYRNNNQGALGSLVLGGYDASRMTGGISVPMVGRHNHTLLVSVQAVEYTPSPSVEANSESISLEEPPFAAAIDSTLPYLWLPGHICDEFEKKFQLTYNDEDNIYTVNASDYNYNRQQNATVTFKLSTTDWDRNTYTTISLPFSAFDLELGYPIVPNSENATKYFPIRKSKNGMFVLGRAFLQEAYIVVDYERLNFTIAPALFPDSQEKAQIIPIYDSKSQPKLVEPPSTPPNSDGSGGLPPGAVAGVVVGIVLFFVLLALGGFLYWRRRRARQPTPEDKLSNHDIDTTKAGEQIRQRRVSELDSEPPTSPKPSFAGYYNNGEGKDITMFPPINEMESPPAVSELYSPPPPESYTATPSSERAGADYFVVGGKIRRRGATRDSSTGGTPGTPIAELPGDSALTSKIDEMLSEKKTPQDAVRSEKEDTPPATLESRTEDTQAQNLAQGQTRPHSQLERQPSHSRGLSDTTIQSESTAVSQPSPEELQAWERERGEPRRPLSE